MYKLKDIISSGGTNPKINKAIDRYELSKDEKKDIISAIKTNVPQSGGSGGGSEGGGSNVVYLNIEPVVSAAGGQFEAAIKVWPGILAIKLVGNNITSIVPVSYTDSSYLNETKAAAILPNFRGLVEESNDINSDFVIEQLKQLGATEITKEEFYTI